MPWSSIRIYEIEQAANHARAARRLPPPALTTRSPRGGRPGRFRPLGSARTSVGIVTALVLFGATAARAGTPHERPHRSSQHARVQVKLKPGRSTAIPSGFLGLSLEYYAVEPYAGQDPHAINPVFEQLVRNLTAGQSPVLRIGGDSTDWTWWPVPHMARPPGVTFTLSNQWLSVTHALTTALHARLILGINLEANSVRLAAAEARALLGGIGRRSVAALEIGNEPELYPSFAWYHTPNGRGVPGRSAGYGFATFAREFAQIGRAVRPAALAGPTSTASGWLSHWSAFLHSEPRLSVATLHRYGLHDCTSTPAAPGYPTPRHLLLDSASVRPAMTARRFAAIAHAHHVPLRIDEMNSTPCYGAPPIAGESFASALWALDSLFEMASVGVDGVNIHTYPAASYNLFTFTNVNHRWEGTVNAEYYGLLMFAHAAPAGSRLLRIASRPVSAVKAWATAGRDHKIRVVLINDGDRTRSVTLTGFASATPATVEALRAPSITSRSGVTLGGQSFGAATTTGLLTGRAETTMLRPARGAYVVTLPATSALVVTIGSRPQS
jgi:hypothetical protein